MSSRSRRVTAFLLLASMFTGAPALAQDPPMLTIATMAGPFTGTPIAREVAAWEAASGGRAEVHALAYANLEDTLAARSADGPPDFDLVIHPAAWLPDLAPHLAPVPDAVLDEIGFEDIHAAIADLGRWRGRVLALPVGAELLVGVYRRDLFEDENERAAFRAAFGRELAPPATWEAYDDISIHFTRPHTGLFGSAQAVVRGGQAYWTLLMRAAAHAGDPDDPSGLFFDPVTMAPRIASPGWRRALEEVAAATLHAPPGRLAFGQADVRMLFAAGRIALAIDAPDIAALAADPRQSRVANRVGYFALPGATSVFDHAAAGFVPADPPGPVPLLTGGWFASVPAGRDATEAAFDLLAWLTRPEAETAIARPALGFVPYRSHVQVDARAWTGAVPASELATVVTTSLDAPRLAQDLRLPGRARYVAALENAVVQAATGRATPEAALAAAAAAWDEITDELGRETQREAWQSVHGRAGEG